MTLGHPIRPFVEDPLLAALDRHHPISSEVLDLAINFREACIDRLCQEIEILKKTHRRLTTQKESHA